MNTTTPSNKVDGAIPPGVPANELVSAAEMNNLIDAVNSKVDRDALNTAVDVAHNIDLNVANKRLIIVTLTGVAPHFNAPTGAPYDGQEIWIRMIQGPGGLHQATWDAVFQFSEQWPIPDTSQSIAGQVDYAVFIYNATTHVYECVGWHIGYNLS